MAAKPEGWKTRPITHTEPLLITGEKSFDEMIEEMQRHHLATPDPIVAVHMGLKALAYYRKLCQERGDPLPMAASFLLGCPVYAKDEQHWPTASIVVIAKSYKDGNSYILMAVNIGGL